MGTSKGKKPEAPAVPPKRQVVTIQALDSLVEGLRDLVDALSSSGIAPQGLAAYRTVTAARNLIEMNRLLKEGWDLLHLDFCEEIIQRDTATRAPKAASWQPYAILGKAEPMAESDRRALGLADQRATREHEIESGGVDDEAQRQEESTPEAPSEAEANGSARGRPARGRRVILGRDRVRAQERIPSEGTGALAGRV